MIRKWCRSWQQGALVTLLSLLPVAFGQETGYIQVVTDPGIRVSVNGQPAGVTNEEQQGIVLANLAVGAYNLRFERDGFKPFVVDLRVRANDITVYTLHSFAPEPQINDGNLGDVGYLEARTGRIVVFCLPVLCTVNAPELGLDNYTKGTAPLVIGDVFAVSHEFSIRVGRQALREELTVQPNATLQLFADFTQSRPALYQVTIPTPPTRASSDRQSAQPGRTPGSSVQSYEVTQDRPLDVLIDNADAAYPQQGLVEASSVFEMPIERGLTRLMAVYTQGEPVQLGPIRDARDYFLEAALQMNGTLVHVGGAPSTMSRIENQRLATIDALQDPSLFAQAPDRLSPHDVFSTGEVLREATGRLPTPVSGTLYAPPSEAPTVNTLSVSYSSDYASGFRYMNDLDQYRWVRNGTDATDTEGTAITADAVVIAQITALPYPDDPEGRLYLPYSGGPATLYLRGKAVAGSWTPEGGFAFTTERGDPVDLRPFKAWLLFTPEDVRVNQN